VGPTLEAPDFAAIVGTAVALPPGTLQIGPDVEWDREAEARAVMAGFATKRAQVGS
jgi:hypothetical protein